VEARKAAAPAGAQAGTTADRSILGDAADATTIAAITSIVRELLSCANVGAFLQGFMLFSPDYYRRFRAEIGLTDAEFRAEFGTIRPKPQEEWSEIAAVRDARTLPDGRVTAAFSYTNAAWTIPQPEESYTFVRLLDADYWLIDDITPLVGDDPGSTAAYQKDHSIAAMSTAADLVIIDPESKSTK
jgi:hypothetical protein